MADMKLTKQENFLQKVLMNPGKWVHLRRPNRKNNLHDKSDERSRKKIFAVTCQSLRLLGIGFAVRETYFIKVE